MGECLQDPDGTLSYGPCRAPLSQISERRRRVVHATQDDNGELVPADDRAGYVTTTSYVGVGGGVPSSHRIQQINLGEQNRGRFGPAEADDCNQ